MHDLSLSTESIITAKKISCTCNEPQVYFRDVFLLPMKRNGDTQGVPADLVFRDQASLCTGDVLPGGFSLSFSNTYHNS